MKRVFIIGNGFDLAHGLKTGYFAFRDFLKSTDRTFYDQIKEYYLFEGDDLWRNFESNLSKIDVETLTSYANLRCNDDMDYDSMEGDNIDIAVAEELNYIDGLSEKIREWVSGTVDLSACNKIIASSYLTALSSLTNMKIQPSVPYIAVDMAAAILSVPAIQFGQFGDNALFIATEFGDEKEMQGYFILMPEQDSYEKILRALGIVS